MNSAPAKHKARKGAIAKPHSDGVVSGQIHNSDSNCDALSSQKLIRAIKLGLPVSELERLRKALDVPMDKLALQLGMSIATLHRRKAQGRLEPDESDHVLRFARLVGKAVSAFGDIEDARQWLNSPQRGLGGAIPLDYARTEIGGREVENLLGRIEHGVYS